MGRQAWRLSLSAGLSPSDFQELSGALDSVCFSQSLPCPPLHKGLLMLPLVVVSYAGHLVDAVA